MKQTTVTYFLPLQVSCLFSFPVTVSTQHVPLSFLSPRHPFVKTRMSFSTLISLVTILFFDYYQLLWRTLVDTQPVISDFYVTRWIYCTRWGIPSIIGKGTQCLFLCLRFLPRYLMSPNVSTSRFKGLGHQIKILVTKIGERE